MTTELTGAHLIGFDDVTGTGETFRAVDPATAAPLEPGYTGATTSDVARAAALAARAFPRYRATTLKARAAFLDGVAAHIEALGETPTERVTAETGLPAARAASELARTTGQLRLFADVVRDGGWLGARIDPARPDRTPLPRPDVRQRSIPLGPVAVFAASNFPLAFSVAGGDTASALAAGAPVVVKAHPSHPGTSELIGRAVRAAVREHGMPEGTFSLLHGPGHDLGHALVTDLRIKAVGFTGSRQGGLALVAAAAARPEPIPLFAEMSATNPVFLLPRALAGNPAGLARDFVASMTGATGQMCTSPGLVFACEGPELDAFTKAAAEEVQAHASATMLSSSISDNYRRSLDELEDTDGVEVIARGPDGSVGTAGRAAVCVTDAATFLKRPELQCEVFGPAALIVTVSDPSRLAELAEALEGQLTATVHAADSDHSPAARLLDVLELKAGRVIVNGWPTGVEVGHAMVHGGPYPSTSAPATTSVGTRAIERFLRPVAYQNLPTALTPPELRDGNPLDLWRLHDGVPSRD